MAHWQQGRKIQFQLYSYFDLTLLFVLEFKGRTRIQTTSSRHVGVVFFCITIVETEEENHSISYRMLFIRQAKYKSSDLRTYYTSRYTNRVASAAS